MSDPMRTRRRQVDRSKRLTDLVGGRHPRYMTVVATSRLDLRELAPADVDALTGMYSDLEVMRFIGMGGVRTREDAARAIAAQQQEYRDRGYGEWATIRRDTGAMIGMCGVIRWPDIDGVEELEVAYMLARDAWGRGYATEAAIAIRDWAFAVLTRERMVSLIYHDNAASIAVARNAGATWEKDVSVMGQSLALYVYRRLSNGSPP